MSATLEERFWAKVQRGQPDDCWPWIGANDGRGYGQIWAGGRNRRAHRVAWEIANGMEFPPEMDACHTCDNPPCVNPVHIFPGTAKDNARDAMSKDRLVWGFRRNQTHCKRGHPFSWDNTRIEPRGFRECRECRRQRNAARYR